jgi:hypothetical protein
MGPTDRRRFATCLLAMSEIYGKPISEAVTGVWWNALKSWDIEAVEQAFSKHTQSPDVGQYMPKPADVIRMLAGTTIDAAMVAWAKVDKAVRSVGSYASVAFDDPIIHRTLQDMGGWIALGQKDDESWPFVGNEFRNRYQGYRSRGETPEYPRTLIGLAEAHNAKLGLRPTLPTLIGDPDKARAVMTGGTDKPCIGITHQTFAAPLRLVDSIARD